MRLRQLRHAHAHPHVQPCTCTYPNLHTPYKPLVVVRASCRTALHLACSQGQLQAVEVLLEAGALLDVSDRWGHTPQDDATSGGHAHIVALLEEVRGSAWLAAGVPQAPRAARAVSTPMAARRDGSSRASAQG